MGGYAFTIRDDHGNIVSEGNTPDFLPSKQPYATLTAKGILFLLKFEPDIIPDLSTQSIAEKTKSNTLGKAIMTVQVVWFCLNCISRLVEDLPLSLLEVSTLAHGFCTLLSCAVWWHKPFNIDSPSWIRIDSSRAREAVALLCLGDPRYPERPSIPHVFDPVFPVLDDDSYARQTLDDYALNAAKRYGLSERRGDPRCFGPDYLKVTRASSTSFGDLFKAFAFDKLDKFVLVSMITPIIYGSLHFLGWRTQFPTPTERILWRVATVVAMSPGAVAATSFIISRQTCGLLCRARENVEKTRSEKTARRFQDFIASFVIPLVYSVASLYLLFESVRQLWYLSPDAYKLASWSYYVPHLF